MDISVFLAILAICVSGALSKPNDNDYDLCKNWRSYRGYHVPNPDNCKTYYQCQANADKKGGYEAILRNCGTGTGFDPNLGICNDLNFLEGCIRLTGTLCHLCLTNACLFGVEAPQYVLPPFQ